MKNIILIGASLRRISLPVLRHGLWLIISFNLCFLSPSFIRINSAYGQDIHFSQFYQTPLIINPALTGTFNGQIRVIMNYKDQWGSVVDKPYRTYAVSYDMTLFKEKWENGYLGAGFSVYKDKAGNSELGILLLNLSLSGIITLNNRQKLSAGLQGGFAQRSINYDGLYWGKYYENGNFIEYNTDPVLTSGISHNYTFGDFAAGVSWSLAKNSINITSNDQFVANVGIALFHVNKPKQEFFTAGTDETEKLYPRFVLHGGTYIGLKNTNINLLPSILFLQQGPTSEVNIGLMARYTIREESRYTGFVKETAVLLGGYFRAGDAIIPTVMFEIANFAVGVSYDVNISGLKAASSGKGGVEISLRYITPNPFRYGKGTKGTPML